MFHLNLRKKTRSDIMEEQIDDVRINQVTEVITPHQLMHEAPLDPNIIQSVFDSRERISKILHKKDDRLLIIIGPCSIHDPEAAMDYADKLQQVSNQYEGELEIVMRVYFEKPRTTIGWKGYINDPDLDGSNNIDKGLRLARQLLVDVSKLGLPAATEFLDPITPQYIGDLISWGAIGARTTESQIHRQLASGLSAPIGFKNGTDGSIQIAIDAIKSAMNPHMFLSVTKDGKSAIVSTTGNRDCHVIHRGGNLGENFSSQHINRSRELLEASGINTGIMVDLSHANSDKDFKKQAFAASSVCQQLSSIDNDLVGVMIESNLVEGRQNLSDKLVYGQSVTDACLGWDSSLDILDQLSHAVKTRRLSQSSE